MPVDLVVTAVKLPSPFRAPCPATIAVTVTNQGNDIAIARRFDVVVDFASGSDLPSTARFTAQATGPDERLQPGQSINVPVRVNCPCGSPIWIRADVDPAVNVPDNLHSQPPFALQATPDLVPWLVTSVRVGLVGYGKTFFDVGPICPDAPIVVEVGVENRGCADSPPTTVDVSIEDSNGNVLSTQNAGPFVVFAHRSVVVPVNARAPKLAQVPGRLMTVRAIVDPGMTIVDQCVRSTLSTSATLPIDAGRPPRLSLSETKFFPGIAPGETPSLKLTFVNDCSDVGQATARVTYGTPPVQIAIGGMIVQPRSTTERGFVTTIPPAIANEFWTIGTHTLTVEVLASGRDPGPYTATYDLVVQPRPPFWTWPPPPIALMLWKSPYTLPGTLAPSSSGKTVTLIDCVQHDTSTTGALADRTRTPNVAITNQMLTTPATAPSSFTFTDTWTWVSQPYFYKSGPTFRTFEYRARFTGIDVFGNDYGTVTSQPQTITVAVSGSKIANQMAANAMTIAGTPIVAAGAVCFMLAAWPWNLICVAVMATGMALVIGGTLLGYDAMDPPIPDFGPHGSPDAPDSCTTPTWSEWKLPCMDDHPAAATLNALNSLTSLLRRFVRQVQEATRARDRAHAAFIDGDQDGLRQRKSECVTALDAIGRIVAALPDVLSEVEQRAREQRVLPFAPLPKRAKPATSKELLKIVHERAKELEIPKADLATVTPAIEQSTPDLIRDGLTSLRKDGVAHIGAHAKHWYDAQRAAYAELPYLR